MYTGAFIQIEFYDNATHKVDEAELRCGPPSSEESTPTPEPSPISIAIATPTPIRDDQDIDDFKTFDSLTPRQQVQVLTERGPRLREKYHANDLSMRVLVKGGWPILLDYGLASDRSANLSIALDGVEPFTIQIAPAIRKQIGATGNEVRLPASFGSEVKVAKLHLTAFKSNGQPADFQLYGFAMGENGVQAGRRANGPATGVQLAINRPTPPLVFRSLPLALFHHPLQVGSAIQINVALPTTIKVNQNPKKVIQFSFTSRADFSSGRWEWWHVNGLDWKKVWQKGTGGISRNQTKSDSWDGIITSPSAASTGAHALQLAAWQQGGNDRDWVIAHAPKRLTVIK